MPNYTFENQQTGEQKTISCSSSDIDKTKAEEGIDESWIQVFKMNIVSGVGSPKTSDGWKDVLKSIKKANPRSNIKI